MIQPTEKHGAGMASVSTSIILFGEVLFDCFPDGRRVLGGAPFNVAWGLRGFGVDPVLISAVGVDSDGEAILADMQAWGMRTDGIQSHVPLATGTVEITLVDGDARYEIASPRAWDEITDMNFTADDILYHGSLALRSDVNRDTLKQIIERSGSRRFYDVNLRPPHTGLDLVRAWLPGAAWVKCNLEELQLLLDLSSLTFAESGEAGERFLERYNVENLLVTAGGEGARVVGREGSVVMSSTEGGGPIIDTVGAGDSFSAVFIQGLIHRRPVAEVLDEAGAFARRVCSMRGATTDDRKFYTLQKEQT